MGIVAAELAVTAKAAPKMMVQIFSELVSIRYTP